MLVVVVCAVGENGRDVLVYGAGVLNSGFLHEYLRGVRQAQGAEHPANVRSLGDTLVTISILRSC